MDGLDPAMAPLLVRYMRAPPEQQARYRQMLPDTFTDDVCEDLADATEIILAATSEATAAYNDAREVFAQAAPDAPAVAPANSGGDAARAAAGSAAVASAMASLPTAADVESAADRQFVQVLQQLMTAAQAEAAGGAPDALPGAEEEEDDDDDESIDLNQLPTQARLQMVLPLIATYVGLPTVLRGLEPSCRLWHVTLRAKGAREAVLWGALASGAGVPPDAVSRVATRADAVSAARALPSRRSS